MFSTLLIANRGEIARRIIRSARAMGIRCVGVYVDADAGAPFVGECDEAIRLESGYLDAAAIVAAARRSGAEAVHPGYGFLSENAEFARAVIEAGLVWVGPSPEVIDRMGDKLAAKELAEKLDIPMLPSSENPTDAKKVGFPLLVKAAAGGGGKGMRIVEDAAVLDESIAAAKREALGGFGDDRVFLEHYVARSRHVEIQILGDSHGNVVHLGERECSIQRRHQKIIEESPSSRVDHVLRQAMSAAALRLARELKYESAGTVEFLVDDESGKFYFLEVNTRLQVEHPVTEAVTGLDLVREQLFIAAGEAIEFDQDDISWNGAAIEARLYAEDPAAGFLPATGTLIAYEPADEPMVRWDSGVAAGSEIGVHFDPMLAKVIAHAPTRTEAATRLALALERTHLGGVTTNRDFLVATLRSPEFLDGDTTTDFIDRVAPPRKIVLRDDELDHVAVVAALWLQGMNRTRAGVLESVPSGWRNARLPDQAVTFACADREVTVSYHRLRDGAFQLGGGGLARLHDWQPAAVDVEVGNRRFRSRIARSGDRLVVETPRGDVELILQPRFPQPGATDVMGGLVAPMPGKVIDVRVKVGDQVSAGDVLVVLEAMKMEHPMAAPQDGVVNEVHVAVGDQVESGALLLHVEPLESEKD